MPVACRLMSMKAKVRNFETPKWSADCHCWAVRKYHRLLKVFWNSFEFLSHLFVWPSFSLLFSLSPRGPFLSFFVFFCRRCLPLSSSTLQEPALHSPISANLAGPNRKLTPRCLVHLSDCCLCCSSRCYSWVWPKLSRSLAEGGTRRKSSVVRWMHPSPLQPQSRLQCTSIRFCLSNVSE